MSLSILGSVVRRMFLTSRSDDDFDRGSNRKRKRGGLVVSQMRSEALHNQRVAVVEYGEHLVRRVTADHSDGTRRDRPGVAPVVDGERLLQGCLDTAHAGQADDP